MVFGVIQYGYQGKQELQWENTMIEIMENLILMGEGMIKLAKDTVVYAGSGAGGLFILYKSFHWLRKL